MKNDDLKVLDRMADDLSVIAERLRDDEDGRPTSPSASVRKASYLLQDAVGELMAQAARQHFNGAEISEFHVLRPQETRA